MATVGDILIAPEAGWRRYEDSNSQFSYSGSWTAETGITGNSDGSLHYTNVLGNNCSFNFYGSKIRIIGTYADNYSTLVDVVIDGTTYNYNQYATSVSRSVLVFEKQDLSLGNHSISVINRESGKHISLDAIEIDENGELKPYNPNIENALLRVTMTDSSEREYQLPTTDIEGFISWFNQHTSTSTAGYMLNKKIGLQSSKDYLAFDKIISFEVIPIA